jgi:mRNA-degrading endonuclease RelE of RelBE toxin-antitoxin system
MYIVFYLDETREDILQAKQWYAGQQDDLDTHFVLVIKEAVAAIVKMPSAYAIRYKNVRIAHVKVFPYNIHFFIDEAKKIVVITGIVHNKKKDALFLKR